MRGAPTLASVSVAVAVGVVGEDGIVTAVPSRVEAASGAATGRRSP